MIPADQRLHADNSACGELDLRLIVKFKLVVFEGVPQIIGNSDPLAHLTIEVIRMEAILVAAFVLGPIESEIGLRKHLIGACCLGHIGRNPDARGDMHFRVAERIGSPQGIVNLRRQRPGIGEIDEICFCLLYTSRCV